MKYYMQFLNIRNNIIYENLGSEGVFILDGRNNLNTMIEDAFIRLERFKHLHQIDGFKIIKASSFLQKGKIIHTWISPEKNNFLLKWCSY